MRADPTPARSARVLTTLPAIDLNLFKVFFAVHQMRQVTAAAQHLDMTPSAVSNALTRLRSHVGDQLFVRTQRGVVPTPYADRLAESVAVGLQALEKGLRPEEPFAPERSDRIFSINLADVGQMLMIGDLMRGTSEQAPGVRIRTVDLPVHEVEAALVRGEIDLAVGHLSAMGKTLFRRKLVNERFVCVVGQQNDRYRDGLSVEDFLAASHIRYTPGAVSLSRINIEIDRFFRQKGCVQRVALEAAHAFGLSAILAETHHVLTVPARLAAHYARITPVSIHALPLKTPSFDISLYWHERHQRDEAHSWFRDRFAAAVKDFGAAASFDNDER